MKSIIHLLFFGILAYLGWDYYSFTTDASSALGVQRAQLVQKQDEVNQKERKFTEAKEFYKNLERKRDELRALSNELATMKLTLTETIDIPAFMKLVLSEAKRVGVTVTGLSPLASKKEQYYVEQPFDLTFQGVYVQLIAFLDRLAQAERIVRIDDFTVKPRATASKAGRFVDLEGSIKVRSYVYLGTQEDEVASKGGSDAIPKTTLPKPGAPK